MKEYRGLADFLKVKLLWVWRRFVPNKTGVSNIYSIWWIEFDILLCQQPVLKVNMSKDAMRQFLVFFRPSNIFFHYICISWCIQMFVTEWTRIEKKDGREPSVQFPKYWILSEDRPVSKHSTRHQRCVCSFLIPCSAFTICLDKLSSSYQNIKNSISFDCQPLPGGIYGMLPLFWHVPR